MRVVKDPIERKNEILDAAQELFITKGFDGTSTNDIIDKVKIARGTLYYHFKSKEDILDSLIHRITSEAMAQSVKIARDKSIPLLERFCYSIKALNIDTDIGHEVIEQVHKPQNALMHQKMQNMLVTGIVPIITELVKEGINEGIFHTDYPDVAVEMSMIYSNIAFDGIQDMNPDEMMRKAMGFIANVERMMGCEQGLMFEPIMKIFQG